MPEHPDRLKLAETQRSAIRPRRVLLARSSISLGIETRLCYVLGAMGEQIASRAGTGSGGGEGPLGAGVGASLRARRRLRRFASECERLRPLGEAYLLRHFEGQLSRADAEDAVAEVLIRLHRQGREGRAPDNLRAAFLSGARNAAIDILRLRTARPTVALEDALAMPDRGVAPGERAEGREDGLRLREALLRLRGRYRETIMLRFGLGLTVPEIAAHFEISLPAAKKLVLLATREVRQRMAAIEDAELCPEARRSARRLLFEKEACDILGEDEEGALRAHLAHCGPCRAHLHALRERLHDLGSVAVLGLAADPHLGGALSGLGRFWERLGEVPQRLGDGLSRARELVLRSSGAPSSGEGPAGAVLGGAQKVAAICGAGATATAACVFTGAGGPGLHVAQHHHAHRAPPAKVRSLAAEAPAAPSGAPSSAETLRTRRNASSRQSAPAPSSAAAPEFGIEGGSSSSVTEAPASPPQSEADHAPSTAGSRASVGFQG